MLTSAGNEPRFPSIRQQVESITPSWLLVFHLFKKVQVRNQQPRWCSGLNLLSYSSYLGSNPAVLNILFAVALSNLSRNLSRNVKKYDRSVAAIVGKSRT